MSKARNIFEGWAKSLAIKLENASPEVKERHKKCMECPFLHKWSYSKTAGLCKKCGCMFPQLVYASKKKCPEGKW